MRHHIPQNICQFGFAMGDITPPVGMYHRMWGAATHDRSTGIHRPLRASVAVFAAADGQGDRSILIALDHCIMGAREMDNLLTAASHTSGAPRQWLVVVCGHTHAAGLMSLDRAALPGGEMIAPYLEQLGQKVGRLISEATAGLGPAMIVYGQSRCSLASHRDLWDPETNQFVCGFNPDSPADDIVLLARVVDRSDNLLCSVVNYACHPTTLAWQNTLISPDFPGAMREVVEQATGAPCLFLQGASAELGPREGFVGDTAVADRNGRQLGYAALSGLTSLPAAGMDYQYQGPVLSGATIGAWKYVPIEAAGRNALAQWRLERLTIPLPYRADLPAADEVRAEVAHWQEKERQAAQLNDLAAAEDAHAMVERKNRLLSRVGSLPAGEKYPLAAVVWRLGDAVWVAVQGEHYSLLQTRLRRRFPGVPIIVATLAFDWTAAYLPPREAYGKGIYQESVAILAPGSAESAINTLGDHIERLLETGQPH